MTGNLPEIEKGDLWIKQEDEILRLYYPNTTLKNLLKLLPHRPIGSIYNRAVYYLNLKRDKDYEKYIKAIRIKKLKKLHKKNTKELKNTNITKDVAYLYGVIIGDGNISQRKIYIATIDKDFILLLKDMYDKWSGLVSTVKKYKNINGNYLWYVFFCSKRVAQFFDSLKIEDLKTKEQKASFLRGFMDAEGHITVYKYKKKRKFNYRVGLDNTNKNLMLRIGHLLSELGIKYTLNYEDFKGRNHIGKLSVYRIVISHNSLIPFYNKIGFRMPRKRDKLVSLVKEKHGLVNINDK